MEIQSSSDGWIFYQKSQDMSILLSLFGGIGYNIRYKGMNEYVSCYRNVRRF